ncbi:MAG TPA: phosphate regulon sensor protein PhoR, partial [Xanthomonadaceae bacterium]|nr:phosphate regulon sensor protein PhoR [Xanthomonadaceae bacterium]
MTSAPDNVWLPTLARMALVLAAAVALGWLAGWPRIALALAALGLLGWQLWRLQQVLARIEARQAIG